MKYIIKSLVFGVTSLLLGACNDSVSDLLEPKVYFENKEYNLTVDEGNDISVELSSRLTSAVSSNTNVTYSVADSSLINEYNAKYGTNYLMIDTKNVSLSATSSTIPGGTLYADKVEMTVSNLDEMQAGKSYIVPISVQSNSLPTTPGGYVTFFIIQKPIKITKAGSFWSDYISIKFPAGTYFKSFTYEAIIKASQFTDNNTIMGNEGIMILRIGDEGGGIPRGIVQIAGNQNYYTKDKLKPNTWYHVACTYDQGSGKTAIYVNGNKWAESGWAIPGFDPNYGVGFYIGKISGFQWGERPFFGYMSEVRVWSVARTQNQLKNNMLNVDPKSEGLELYYKLDGSEQVEGRTIKDATGKIEGTTSGIDIQTLDAPVEIK